MMEAPSIRPIRAGRRNIMKNIISCIYLVGFLVISISVIEVADLKSEARRFEGKITAISGNTITIKDSAGNGKRLEVRSVGGLKTGMVATCEEDCGSKIRIGDKIINVQRELPCCDATGNRQTPSDASPVRK